MPHQKEVRREKPTTPAPITQKKPEPTPLKLKTAHARCQTPDDLLRVHACELFFKELVAVAAEQEALIGEQSHAEMVKRIRYIIDRVKGKAGTSTGVPAARDSDPFKGRSLAVTLSPPNRFLSPQDERSWHFDVGT